jgi:GNAT superfamily N-acetyltransferase
MAMKIVKATLLNADQKKQVCQLWNTEYPQKLAITIPAFDAYLGESSGHTHFLILENNTNLIGWANTFDRAGERWFAIIIDGTYQRKGLGHLLLNLSKEKEHRLNGWVIDHPYDVKQNGDNYLSPLSFYLRNGFTALPNTRFENEKISALKIEWRKG